MRNILFIFLLSFAVTGCKFSRSAEKDLLSGLTFTGSDLSCEDVRLSVNNEKITVKPSGVSYDEIYLYSQGKNKVISNNEIEFDDNIYVIVEGLKGFREENGIVFPGLELKAADMIVK
jgi:hypothetical protein